MEDPYLKRLLWLKRIIKASLFSLTLLFSLFSRFSGVLVEGSYSSIDKINVAPSANAPYLSSQSSLIGANIFNATQKIQKVVVTAYSSTEDQTDDTPFITASNKVVEDGIVASNFLPFGTKIRLPELFGDKIFIVEDRMHHRFSSNHLDIWMPTRELAQNFGVKETFMEIIK